MKKEDYTTVPVVILESELNEYIKVYGEYRRTLALEAVLLDDSELVSIALSHAVELLHSYIDIYKAK